MNWKKPGSAAPTSFFKNDEHRGELLGVEVLEVTKEDGKYGEKPVTYGNVTVFETGETFTRAKLMGSALARQLRSKVGEQVLGRLVKERASEGSPESWWLKDPTDQDIEIANGGAVASSDDDDDDIPPWEQ
ncbi:hypothetical protein EF847_01445 [Actinobacteria bacterium YIM 96077]|uniref:Uncharacterized protein n=1 Tax=Phytoactinopolyspora halophila TaxID=1981511 RepID=A0A329QGQ6_9ACTN|nr:hypothetical protein [Phytoactinopolyspora halophila]AYY11585.1 hypothetical protein EF847_01445 [Actinobacteria bacterium YIM 96077]RAW11131.1 hypothetical protein DPM12_17470 [Phytoactinopolyspora halophila]